MIESSASISDWLPRLSELSAKLIEAPTRTRFDEALAFLIDILPGRAGQILIDGEVVSESGFSSNALALHAREAAMTLVSLALDNGEATVLLDTRRGPYPPELGAALHAEGCLSAVVSPLAHRDRSFGAICIWLDERFVSCPEVETTLDHLTHLLSLALERDNRSETAEGGLLSLGEMNRLASLGLLLDSSLHALRTPSSSLVIQLDELRRQATELSLLLDPADSLAFDGVRELQQTLDDMAVAASVVQRELTRLADVQESGGGKTHVELSRLVHEAVAIARPELEQRGFTVEEFFSSDATIQTDRQDLLHLMLGALFALGKAGQLGSRLPVLEVILDGNSEERHIIIRLRESNENDQCPVPTLPEASVGLARKLGADLQAGPGVLVLSLAVPVAAEPLRSEGGPPERRILIVDDDPMFARALRRALSPHEVRVSSTAGEAELLLLKGDFVPHLVVCDLWLPGSSGRTLHQRIRASLPEIASRFVFVSGAPLTERDRAYFRDAGCRTMTKPIQLEELLDAGSIAPPKPGRLNQAS